MATSKSICWCRGTFSNYRLFASHSKQFPLQSVEWQSVLACPNRVASIGLIWVLPACSQVVDSSSMAIIDVPTVVHSPTNALSSQERGDPDRTMSDWNKTAVGDPVMDEQGLK